MFVRLTLLFALGVLPLIAQQKQPNCCEAESEKLSQKQVRALLQKTEPIEAPCCADMLHLKGKIVLAITVDRNGDVECVQMISGHPLITSVAMQSVARWKFRPHVLKGFARSFCGKVVLRYQASEYSVKYSVI